MIALCLAAGPGLAQQGPPQSPKAEHALPKAGDPWWKHAVIYELYPRSFQDSNGDGVGDINGITSRLDYLRDLGIDAVRIAPMYLSPLMDSVTASLTTWPSPNYVAARFGGRGLTPARQTRDAQEEFRKAAELDPRLMPPPSRKKQ